MNEKDRRMLIRKITNVVRVIVIVVAIIAYGLGFYAGSHR